MKVDEDANIVLATQDLIHEIEDEELNGMSDAWGNGGKEEVGKERECNEVGKNGECKEEVGKERECKEEVGTESEKSVQVPVLNPRMVGILQNMQNSGNVTINYNFDSKQ